MKPETASVVSQTKLRVGRIQFLNAVPFYHHLDEHMNAELRLSDLDPASFKVSYFDSHPSKINQAIREGRIDMAPISSLEYVNQQKKYLLFPDLAIGSRDFSGSVLLFSREKIEGLNGASIALTRQSLSSAALIQIILKFKFKYTNPFVPLASDPDKMLQKHKAALVIGDHALFYKPKEFIYKYDLSELWWNWTAKPFCFALWAVRRSFAKAHPEAVAAFHQALLKAREKNLSDIELLVKEAAGISFMDEKFSKVFGYLFNLNYHLDEEMCEGLQLFYRFAHRMGSSPRAEKLAFLETLK